MTATNSEGSTLGNDETFITDAPPPTVFTGNAAQITSTGATLIGSINPNGAPTKYYFEYGLTEAYGTATALTALGDGITALDRTEPITGLQSNFTYNFRVVAVNIEGTFPVEKQDFHDDAGRGGTSAPSVATGAATSIGRPGRPSQGW